MFHILTLKVKEKYPDLDLYYLPNREELVNFLVAELSEGDLCLTMGAGDITSLPEEIKYSLGEFRA